MSLASLCNIHTVSIQRQDVTNSDAMSNKKTYTTAARGSLPTTGFKGRIVPLSTRERVEFGMRDYEMTHRFYTVTNPQVDERDILIYGTRRMNVLGFRNPDELNRYWIVELSEQSAGPK